MLIVCRMFPLVHIYRILKESLIHWSLELLLGGGRGRGRDVADGGCDSSPVSSSSSSTPSSSSSSEYPFSALKEASDSSEEPLYS